MTLHAHTQNGAIDQVGALPRLWHDGTRWHDWRGDPAGWGTQPADCGWLPVVETDRPANTDTTTYDDGVQLVAGVPTRVWTPRPWTAEELAAQAEQAAYEAQQAVDRAILDATAALMSAAHTDGEAWVQPVGAHDSYALGATVTHAGKTWANITPANVWAPGVSGWREVVTEGYPAWVQPTGAHDAYGVGDRVTFEGADYESLIPANTYSPTVYPQGWRKL